jgi:opacity protein-like surface antigen
MQRFLVLATLVLVASLCAASARADGDPASDVLYVQDVFVPYPSPPADTVAALETIVKHANAAGLRLKVAVLASQTDMGTARSLFNRPGDYAKFLGYELSYNYEGLLLVVMPAGFGVYKKDAATTEFEHAVSSVNIEGPASDALMRTATAAVRRLIALGPKTVDKVAPTVRALVARAKRGARADLVYAVNDDSGRSREVVKVYAGTRVVATLRSPVEVTRNGILDSVRWRIPAKPAKAYRFCVVATDPAGNASRASCAAIRIS